MFGKKRKNKLDEVEEKILEEMSIYPPDSDEYNQLLKSLQKVYKLRAKQRTRQVSPDTVILAAANVLGILIIVAYEQRHVISSKALSFIIKAK